MHEEIIKRILKGEDLNKVSKEVSKAYKKNKLPKNIELLLSASPDERERLFKILKTKPGRTISGVAPIAVMTKPGGCPHGRCIMCPGGPDSYFGNVPQSYTGLEPATRRAIRNKYHPYLQVMNRLEQYFLLGQYPAKVELIIMGGTFLSYPKKYQEWFVAQCIYAMNDFSKLGENDFFRLFNPDAGKNLTPENDRIVRKRLMALIKKKGLLQVQKENEEAGVKCTALVVETRPDQCSLEQIKFMRRLGVTRVELGVQSIYDDVLKKMERGHSVRDSIDATKRLRDNGFKITYHIMPGCYGSDYERDVKMFKILFDDERFKPDGLKIYPCMVLRGTKLYDIYRQGKFRPITTKEAIKLISEIKKYIPEYCRIMRVQRDIPSSVIEGGVDRTNLRQYIHLNKAVKCRCIRCREVGHREIAKKMKIRLKKYSYSAGSGREIFLSYEDINNDALVAFLRLRLIDKKTGSKLTDRVAYVRELHVYGEMIGFERVKNKKEADRKDGIFQHAGYGKQLLKKAEEIAKQNKISKILIISGIGARPYYSKLGYKLENTYMAKRI